MSRRSEAILAEILRRRREQASKEVAHRAAGLCAARLAAEGKEKGLRESAIQRKAALGKHQGGAWAERQELFVRTANGLLALAEDRDEAVANLRASRERMRQSADALARAIAIERAASRARMIGLASG